MNTRTLLSCAFAVLSALAGSSTRAAPGEVVLKHDDGSMEAKRSTTGGGHAVLFETPEQGDWCLQRVQLFGARYGWPQPPDEDFSIFVTDEALESFCRIAKPYALFEKGEEKWVAMDLPPVRVPRRFYVCVVFNPIQTKGVYVGLDKDVAESHSRDAIPGSHNRELKETADWMIRAHLVPGPQAEEMSLLSPEEREARRLAAIAARDEALLQGAASKMLKHDDGEMDNVQSFGGRGAQTIRFEAPAGEWCVYGVSVFGSQYGARHDAEAVNGDVYILDADLRVVTRTAFPYSLFTYQKAWVEIPVLPTKVSGVFHVAVHAHSERTKGLYVGYDEDVGETHSMVGSVAREAFELKQTKKPLEWMIRAKLADRPVWYE